MATFNCASHRRTTSASVVKLMENGKTALIGNPKKQLLHVTKVDGGVVCNECAADFVVSKKGVGDLIVELKGKEVGKACEQIMATADSIKGCAGTRGKLAAVIVCTRFPQTDTKAQRLMEAFKRMYRGVLRVKTKAEVGEFVSFFPDLRAS